MGWITFHTRRMLMRCLSGWPPLNQPPLHVCTAVRGAVMERNCCALSLMPCLPNARFFHRMSAQPSHADDALRAFVRGS